MLHLLLNHLPRSRLSIGVVVVIIPDFQMISELSLYNAIPLKQIHIYARGCPDFASPCVHWIILALGYWIICLFSLYIVRGCSVSLFPDSDFCFSGAAACVRKTGYSSDCRSRVYKSLHNYQGPQALLLCI